MDPAIFLVFVVDLKGVPNYMMVLVIVGLLLLLGTGNVLGFLKSLISALIRFSVISEKFTFVQGSSRF